MNFYRTLMTYYCKKIKRGQSYSDNTASFSCSSPVSMSPFTFTYVAITVMPNLM